MASFKNHSVSNVIKLLVAADSGSGKTGALASLANAGYKLRIIDADEGLDILASYLTEEGVKNVSYITLKETPKQSRWQHFVGILTNGWKDYDEEGNVIEDLGKITTWGPDEVLVIDTASRLGKYAINEILKNAGKPSDAQVELAQWGAASRLLEARLEFLCSSAVKCNVIVNTHLKLVEDDFGRTRWYPLAVASGLSSNVGNMFNNVVRIDVKTIGNTNKRILRTQADTKMALKSSAPEVLEVEEDLDLARLIGKIKDNAAKKLGKKAAS